MQSVNCIRGESVFGIGISGEHAGAPPVPSPVRAPTYCHDPVHPVGSSPKVRRCPCGSHPSASIRVIRAIRGQPRGQKASPPAPSPSKSDQIQPEIQANPTAQSNQFRPRIKPNQSKSNQIKPLFFIFAMIRRSYTRLLQRNRPLLPVRRKHHGRRPNRHHLVTPSTTSSCCSVCPSMIAMGRARLINDPLHLDRIQMVLLR